MGKTKALIFGSAPCESWAFLEPWRDWPDLVIAADGGLGSARRAGFSPAYYIGDGDSGGKPEPGLSTVVLPEEKDLTDLEAACAWAVRKGCGELLLTGCTGGRLDHELSALGLTESLAEQGVTAQILDRSNLIRFCLPGEYAVEPMGYRYFSLIPVDRRVTGLTIENAKYPLAGASVPRGGSLTVSNEFRDGPAAIRFTGGSVLLIRSK